MIQTLILKSALPLLIGGIIGASGIIGVQKLTKQEIKVSCPEPKVNVSCPPPKMEGNGIDIEKMKGMKGKFTIEQHYHLTGSIDSLFEERLAQRLKIELDRLKVVRCRK